MKIMQVIPNLCFGGAETMCENLSYALKKLGHEVIVVSLYDQHTPIAQRMEEAGVRIVYLDKKLGLDLSMVGKLRRLMLREKPEAVHTHLDVIKYAAAAAKLAGIGTCVHTVHNMADKEAEGQIQKTINGTYFRLGWSVPVALSQEVRQSIAGFYKLPLERIPVAYNGVDLSRCQIKTDYPLRENPDILHIGRFNEQKNHEMLLRAFAKLLQDHPICRLRLVGEGDLRPHIENLAEKLKIQKSIEFCGPQKNVYPYLHDADIFTLPSIYEGMPMTIIEAMGTGLPIVATAVGGVPDMLKNGEDALLVSCDEDALVEAWKRLLADEGLRCRLGVSARKNSLRFSAEGMAEAYVTLYQQ